jgi:4-hydroxyphenylacetate 3-monooxygenase
MFRELETARALATTQRAAKMSAEEKVKFMKLAWDAIGSEFGSRHTQYEMFYAGARFVTSGHSYRTFDWTNAAGMIDGLLATYDLTGELARKR